jgi:hypothetical protein
MRSRKHSGFLVLVLTAVVAGCDATSPSAPTAPSTALPQPIARPTPGPRGYMDVTLSGMVYELTP